MMHRYANALANACQTVLVVAAVAWASNLPLRFGFQVFSEQFLALCLGLSVAAVLLTSIGQGERRSASILHLALAGLALAAALFIAAEYPTLAIRIAFRPPDAAAAALALIAATLVALRLSGGWGIVLVALAFVAYALLGHLAPGVLETRETSLLALGLYLGIDANGMLGMALSVACTIVIPYILFGALLSKFGAADFFTDLASALMGSFRGGQAKVAITASALFGTISGSAVGNVVGTGVVTIPMMKRGGYRGAEAGAIEAVASTGGQLVPPVMGATAFLMAEFLQIPYTEVIVAALFPAFLYYAALFLQVDLIAAKRRLRGLDTAERPSARETLRRGWHFLLPFAALIWGLFFQLMRPETAALLASAVLIAVGSVFGYKGERPKLATFFDTLTKAGGGAREIVVITAAAGIVIGVLNATGTAFGLTTHLVALSGGSIVILLLLAALANIVLGMGMPTVGVYVLLATLIAPSLIQLGVPDLAAHLFILYFGLLSMLTPPVALAAFAGANIARANPWATSWTAMRLGWSAYVVPFLFVASPSLLLIGAPLAVAHAVLTACVGVSAATIGLSGWWRGPIPFWARGVVAAAGVAAMTPARAAPWAWMVEVAGLLILAACVAIRWRRSGPSSGAADAFAPAARTRTEGG